MNSNFYEIDVFDIHQIQSETVLVGKLTFQQLSKIHRLTERKENPFDPFGAKKGVAVNQDVEFQRRLSSEKLNKIMKFLKTQLEISKGGGETENPIGLFPSSIIVSLKHDIDYDQQELNDAFLQSMFDEPLKHKKSLASCFIRTDGSQRKLLIPMNAEIALIVDGQHRFYGVKKLFESLTSQSDKDLINKFEFVTTFLVGFDIYEVGKVFATVNFTQKPVNRSLYYDIFGSVPDPERNEIKLAHDLALHLNNSAESPVQGMIKMLGKGYGLFSQAFIVEKTLIHFKSGGVWEKIYSDYLAGGKEYLALPRFMKMYFKAIKEIFAPAWPTKVDRNGKQVYSAFDYKFILCKTTGMGAFLRLIRDVFPEVEKLSEGETYKQIQAVLSRFPQDEIVTFFSKDGLYGGAGSEGLQDKLYVELRSKLRFKVKIALKKK